MRQKEKTENRVIRTEKRMNDGIVYKYELIATESGSVSSYGIQLYSMRVEMLHGDGRITNCESDRLFADLGSAGDFFEKLVRNLATPLELPYIIEDEFYKHR